MSRQSIVSARSPLRLSLFPFELSRFPLNNLWCRFPFQCPLLSLFPFGKMWMSLFQFEGLLKLFPFEGLSLWTHIQTSQWDVPSLEVLLEELWLFLLYEIQLHPVDWEALLSQFP